MRRMVLIFGLVFTLGLFAEEENKPAEVLKIGRDKDILKKIEALQSITAEEFIEKIKDAKEEIANYIEKKKKVCSGEFSTIILDESENRISSEGETYKKLSQHERKICNREVETIRRKFIVNMFYLRKKYLIFLHQQNLKSLEESYKEALR